MLNKFADELKEIRISKGFDLQQVAVKTRIDYKFLEAMEFGDFEFLPELYVKSFLKEYLKVLGLDEQLYMKKYNAARAGGIYEDSELPTPPAETKKEEIVPEKQAVPEKPPVKVTSFEGFRNYKSRAEESTLARRKKQKLVFYLTTFLVIVASIIYLIMLDKTDEIIITEKPYEEVIGDTAPRDNNLQENAAAVKAVVPGDSLILIIRATDTSWVKIIIDDKQTEEFILFPGSQKSLKSRDNYKITIGNSAGVNLDLNNKPLNFRLSKSIVQRIIIDSSGVKDLAVADQ
jgi:transcriptional regulator with XRE-family HTH domain